MNKTYLRGISAGLVAAMALTTLGGCSGGAKETEAAKTEAAKTESAAPAGGETAAPAEAEATTYPIDTDKKLVYWGMLNSNVSANFTNLGETELGKDWQEQTGVEIEFQHPVTGQDKEQFNLIIADGNYPDLWDYKWNDPNVVPGGAAKAIEDGIILDLTDLINQYAPNLKAYLEAHPEVDRSVKTDDGKYFAFPSLRECDEMCTAFGPMMRKDWLDACGLEAPETIDEWHTALTAFKDQMGCPAPFTWNNAAYAPNNPIGYAYGAPMDFVIDDGKVLYGPAKPEFKDYMKTMAQWYAEGLIDPDIYAGGDDQSTAKMTTGRSGAIFAWCGSGLQSFITTGQTENPEYDMVGLKWPVLNKGDEPEYGKIDNYYYWGGIAIGATCEDPVLACKLLDYGYSEQGSLLFNFGREGESYTMVDGVPTYTDLILKNPDGWPISQAMAKYIMACYQGPCVQALGYQNQYFQLQQAKDAVKNWSDANSREHTVPNITPSQDESAEFASIMNDIKTYVDEMSSKFILGTADVDAEYDKFVQTLDQLGLQRALEIQNGAYERYMNR
ncbi:MAG: extracellular solute-binding protein [Lachnospiraceae bacterium]|nr:extracellular solute-binding protein [Lachnospiraceae bacterium]